MDDKLKEKEIWGKTFSSFESSIRNAIRQVWMYSKPRRDAVKRSRIKFNGKTFERCEICKKTFAPRQKEFFVKKDGTLSKKAVSCLTVHHITTIPSVFHPDFMKYMFCTHLENPADGYLVLCRDCHNKEHSKGDDKDNALRCVQMAVAMQKRMSGLKEKWFNDGIGQVFQIRCGINTGMVNVGSFGSETRKDFTAFGMHVNLASRLEGACDPGGILVSHSTWALVKDNFQFQTKGEIDVKGFSRPVLAYNLVLPEDINVDC
jgi:hypothetical protein